MESVKQTAVEWLEEQIKSKAHNLPTNTKENRMAKGIYVDCLIMAKQAKEMEKQQISHAYTTGVEEDVYSNPLRTGEMYFNEKYGGNK